MASRHAAETRRPDEDRHVRSSRREELTVRRAAAEGYQGCIGRPLDRISVFPDGRAYLYFYLFDTSLNFAQMSDGQVLKNHVYPALGARKMGTITRTDVQSFVTAVSAKLAPSTTETVYAVLRAMMQAAVDDDPQVIPVNPCTRINLPKVTRRVVEPLPAAAVMALHRAISPRYQVAVALGAGLGLREGEAFGLTVPRVDFLRRKVHVLTQAQRGQLGAVLKTDASARTIPADDWVLQQVTSHIQHYGTASARSSLRTGSGRWPGGTRSATPGATPSGMPAPAARSPRSGARTASARKGAPIPHTACPRGRASTTSGISTSRP